MVDWLKDALPNALFGSALTAAFLWVIRHWLKAKLTATVRFETQRKLAELQARIVGDESTRSAIAGAGLGSLANLNAITLPERVKAIKSVWKGVRRWRPVTPLVSMLAVMDKDYVSQHANDDRVARTMQAMLDSTKGLETSQAMNELHQWRPFMTDRAWALWSAYNAFFVGATSRAFALTMKDGHLATRLWEINGELKIVESVAPPEIVSRYRANAADGTVPFLDYVEQQLLEDFRRSLAGEHSAPDAAKNAAPILEVANAVMTDIRQQRGAAVSG